MAQTIEVTCANCGRRFQRDKWKANRYANSYCNDACRGAHKQKRVVRICAHCGNEYETQPTHNQKYCSKACTTQGQIGQERPYMKGRPTWITGLTKETSEIIAKRSQAVTIPAPPRDSLYQLYTEENLTCRQIGQRFDASKGTAEKWIADYGLSRKRNLLTYELLKGLTKAGYSHIEIARMYNCTNSFVGKRAKQFGIAPLYPTYKGGRVGSYGPNWYRQARAVRKRDGYKCRHCGKTEKKNGRALDVHHIIPFRTFGYVHGENDYYLLANEAGNLISLCQKCHRKAETRRIPIQPTLISV